MKKVLKIVLGIVAVGVLIQFYPLDRTVKQVPKSYSILEQEEAPEKIADLLTRACYDCHSNETKYPDYAQYAPVSWYIEYHIEEGRKNANFSRWKKYDADQKEAIVQNSMETLEVGSMPLQSYISKHPEANLSQEDRTLLMEWFQSLLD